MRGGWPFLWHPPFVPLPGRFTAHFVDRKLNHCGMCARVDSIRCMRCGEWRVGKCSCDEVSLYDSRSCTTYPYRTCVWSLIYTTALTRWYSWERAPYGGHSADIPAAFQLHLALCSPSHVELPTAIAHRENTKHRYGLFWPTRSMVGNRYESPS